MQGSLDGNTDADKNLFAVVYEDLRRVADRMLGGERKNHTLQPTALVHEAWLRLIDETSIQGSDERAQNRFLRHAAQAMRRILIDHARHRMRAKRGGDAQQQPFHEGLLADLNDPSKMLDLDAALSEFAEMKPRAGRIAELRIYGGLSTSEAARVVEVSLATAKTEWALARAFLSSKVAPGN